MTHKELPKWLLFLASLTGQGAGTPRVRLWRALKDTGVATMRDGVSLLPYSIENRKKLDEIGKHVIEGGGSVWLFELPEQSPESETQMQVLFDRSANYQELNSQLAELQVELAKTNEATARRQLRQIERQFDSIVQVDFFPAEAQAKARQFLHEMANSINRHFSPLEPTMETGQIKRLDPERYQARLWATRNKLWVDRVASAWLIRRFIDKQAQFIWLQSPADCPDDALGFDFDGASFTHVEDRVTFEVLQTSFGLDSDPALVKLSQLVHYLDVGGIPVPDAAGFEAMLAGLRKSNHDDDALLAAAAPVLDALYQHYATPFS